MTQGERRRAILMAYRRAYDRSPDDPFVNARLELPQEMGVSYEEIAQDVAFLEQNRYLHWKSANVFRISPKGLRATRSAEDLEREF